MSLVARVFSGLNALRPSNRALYGRYRFLRAAQHRSLEENLAFQRRTLHEILSHAAARVPYYRELVRRERITISPEHPLETLRRFPILTKAVLHSHLDELKAEGFEGRYRRNTSGGSTGEQAIFLQDYSYIERGIAWEMVFYEWVGKRSGEKLVKLWGSERDFLEGTRGFQGFKQKYLENVHLLNTFRMTDDDMFRYIDYINREKPRVVEAYVQSIFELSQFAKRRSLDVFSPAGVICSAGTLYPHMKRTIREVFKCPVFNRYGSREVGGVAHSCEADAGLHVNVFSQVVEILDDELQPSKPGETGEIYVTNLDNRVMPLIRFKIGDVAVPSELRECPCGRGLPLIQNVVGRSGCMIRTPRGTMDSTALTTSFYFFESIRRYQFVQKSLDHIEVNIVAYDRGLWEKERESLLEKLSRLLGPSVRIDLNLVEDIEPSPSGKHLYFVSELEGDSPGG